ncbi:MAG: ABC transporter ATP-binding protein, partial [Methanomicrobiales archaeon HGW-Methanomicrobiales-5]
PFERDSIRFLGKKGDEVSFTAENGREALPLIAETLTLRGMKVHSLSLHEPTLDDVFLNVIGSSDEPHSFNDKQFRTMLRRRK